MTDTVRQLLCNNCNTAVGLLRDDPVRAAKLAAYLHRHNPADDNEADAIAILLWALDTHGGVR
jgi:hypothetical protein